MRAGEPPARGPGWGGPPARARETPAAGGQPSGQSEGCEDQGGGGGGRGGEGAGRIRREGEGRRGEGRPRPPAGGDVRGAAPRGGRARGRGLSRASPHLSPALGPAPGAGHITRMSAATSPGPPPASAAYLPVRSPLPTPQPWSPSARVSPEEAEGTARPGLGSRLEGRGPMPGLLLLKHLAAGFLGRGNWSRDLKSPGVSVGASRLEAEVLSGFSFSDPASFIPRIL